MKYKKGFSLIEIIVAMTIVSLLAVTVTISLTQQQVRARDSKRISDVSSLAISLESYRSIKGEFPADNYTGVIGKDIKDNLTPLITDGLLNVLPHDPKSSSSSQYDWCQNYAYNKDWYNAGDSLASAIPDLADSRNKRTYMLYFGTEMKSTSDNPLKHPLNGDIYATKSTGWCNKERGYGYLFGQRTN